MPKKLPFEASLFECSNYIVPRIWVLMQEVQNVPSIFRCISGKMYTFHSKSSEQIIHVYVRGMFIIIALVRISVVLIQPLFGCIRKRPRFCANINNCRKINISHGEHHHNGRLLRI